MCNLLNREFLVIGKSEIDPSAFKDISNDDLNFSKPKGGLWSCIYNKDVISEWVEFCYNEMSNRLNKDCVKFRLKSDIKVFLLDSSDKLKFLLGRYPREIPKEFLPFESTVYLDFEKMKEDYDAFFLDNDWFKSFRMMDRESFMYYLLFEGWDVSSLILFNLNCVESWEYYRLDMEDK